MREKENWINNWTKRKRQVVHILFILFFFFFVSCTVVPIRGKIVVQPFLGRGRGIEQQPLRVRGINITVHGSGPIGDILGGRGGRISILQGTTGVNC